MTSRKLSALVLLISLAAVVAALRWRQYSGGVQGDFGSLAAALEEKLAGWIATYRTHMPGTILNFSVRAP